MNDKEIKIDGKKEKVNILFEYNHIDDLQAYEMIKNGIEITPENAPICNFKIRIVSNTKSPYGFYTIFQKDPKKDKWEYMGFGHAGACSVVSALLGQLKRKEQECEELKTQISKIKEYARHNMFDVDCKNWFDRFIYTFEDWKKSICEADDRYRKALEEIEEYFSHTDDPHMLSVDYEITAPTIIDIISKARRENDNQYTKRISATHAFIKVQTSNRQKRF